MRVCNLASGSSGNCTYIESRQARILIDNGKPLAYVLNALNELGVAPDSIDAILITHEHSDHIKGIEKYSRSFSTPIYAHNELKEIITNQIHIASELFNFYDTDFYIKDLHIQPFPLPHDSKFCVGYRVEEEDAVVSVCTDLGFFSDETFEAIKSSALVFLEANYDPEILKCSPYPYLLKQRIAGPNGHLANLDAAKTISFLMNSGLKEASLGHLSKENNFPELAYKTVVNELIDDNRDCSKIKINVANRSNPSPLINIL